MKNKYDEGAADSPFKKMVDQLSRPIALDSSLRRVLICNAWSHEGKCLS